MFRRVIPRNILVFDQNGAIAQLGERVLCKHEVVGSIPSGSTRSLQGVLPCVENVLRDVSVLSDPAFKPGMVCHEFAARELGSLVLVHEHCLSLSL